jgi:hypothetical protein
VSANACSAETSPRAKTALFWARWETGWLRIISLAVYCVRMLLAAECSGAACEKERFILVYSWFLLASIPAVLYLWLVRRHRPLLAACRFYLNTTQPLSCYCVAICSSPPHY